MEGLRRADRERFDYGYGYLLPWKDQLAGELRELGAEVVCFDAPSNASLVTAIGRVKRYLRSWQADVLHCHLPLSGVVGRLAGRGAGVPVVYTEHNLMERYHPLTRWANRATWRWQESVTAVSEEVASSISRHADGAVPVEVVRNGIDVGAFRRCPEQRREVRRRHGIPAEAPVVGTVAVFRRQKRLDEWLQAVARARERRQDLHGLVVGDGPLAGEVREQVASAGLEAAVHLTGLQECVGPYLSAMDAYLISSDFEGLPVSLLEAMAMELPVISTRVGGVPEVLEDGRTGTLVPIGRPDRLAEEVLRLIADEGLRHEMGREARARVERQFGIGGMIRRFEAIYSDVAGRGRDGRTDH